jgi:hypothetical protein
MAHPAGTEYRCKRCQGEWISRKPGKPVCCAKCKSAYWDRQPLHPKK